MMTNKEKAELTYKALQERKKVKANKRLIKELKEFKEVVKDEI